MEREPKGSRKLFSEAEPFQNRIGQPFAALAGKRKRFHHHGADFLLDIVAQHGAGAVQPCFHGFRLQPENVGGSSTFIPSITRVMNTIRKASGNSSIACSTTR